MRLTRFLALSPLFLAADPAHASGIESQQVVFDLTKGEEVRGRIRWSPARAMDLHEDGLGWDGRPNALYDGWVQVAEPIPVGMPHWAPASVTVGVRIDRDGKGFGGHPVAETVYARYSPDAARWSSWQVLPAVTGPAADRWTHAGRLAVAPPEREAFREAVYRDARGSGNRADAEATLKRILKEDPRYLERAIPFIGYVQVLHESSYYGGQRFRRLEVELTWVVPGPLGPGAHGERWRFREECRVDGEGRLHVPAGAEFRELDLSGTPVTDDGLAALSALPGLRRLDLADTKVTDAGLERVADLRLLEALDLSGTRVTDESLGHLRALSCLDELGLRGTAVTDGAVEGLREALDRPMLHVERQVPAEAKRIERLLKAVEGVTLVRGGTECGGTNASARLRSQLDAFSSRVRTAEDFIEEIAAVKDEPYRVRLADGTVLDLADWLRSRLDR